MEVITPQDSVMEEAESQRKVDRLPFQIFPDPVEVVLSPGSLGCEAACMRQKERLPSIVVEPTEVSEVESGELRWPPDDLGSFEEDEDLFLEQCIPPASIADWGDEDDKDDRDFHSAVEFKDDPPSSQQID
ncbi:protein LBH [Amia ocellicauda]|uniref:protein LBH n=1 Tax=Amia ocellicauda TaxID=2972642 RepID=UPI003464B193